MAILKSTKVKLRAFTLVELSIVIVIIGLIAAGITAGKSLVFSGKIRSQISDLKKYEAASYAFRLAYNTVPGDLPNAGTYWSGAYNGDGNRVMSDESDNANNPLPPPPRENLTFFQQLSKAALIEGSYNGTWQLGVGYPTLKMNNKYGMVAAGSVGQDDFWLTQQLSEAEYKKKHVLALYLNVARPLSGSPSGYNDNYGVASPIEFSALDSKIDDGVARQGMFKAYRAYNSSVGNCLDATDGNYLQTNSQPACHGVYIISK